VSVNNSEESCLDQPGEYLLKPVMLRSDSGKLAQHIPRKQPQLWHTAGHIQSSALIDGGVNLNLNH